MKVSKKDFVAAIADKANVTKDLANKIVDIISDVVIELVKNGDEVKLGDIGIFHPKLLAARDSRVPSTGEIVHVEAKTVPKMRISNTFKKIMAE